MARTGSSDTLLPVLKNEARMVRTALWLRPSAFCIAAALAAVLLASLAAVVPRGALAWLPEVGVDAVGELLKLLAAGMLTVATVTLSVLMLVLSLAAAQVSPRAAPEVMADQVTQNALGTFLATFVYSLTALLLLGFEAVSGPGLTLVIFGALLLALNAVRYLVQWSHHVAEVMKVNHMIHRIHRHATGVLDNYLGGERPIPSDPPAATPRQSLAVHPQDTGYVQLIDAALLQLLARDNDLTLRLRVQEGDFVHPRCCLMELNSVEATFREDDAVPEALRAAVVIGFERSHEGDPRLGFELLAEIACRSMSPAVNDPQSARACVHYTGALLAAAGSRPPADYPPAQSADGRVEFVRSDFASLLQLAFRPVMRDGGGAAEVICAIMAVLRDLSAKVAPDYLDCLAVEARRAEDLGEQALPLVADKQALGDMAAELRRIIAQRRR